VRSGQRIGRATVLLTHSELHTSFALRNMTKSLQPCNLSTLCPTTRGACRCVYTIFVTRDSCDLTITRDTRLPSQEDTGTCRKYGLGWTGPFSFPSCIYYLSKKLSPFCRLSSPFSLSDSSIQETLRGLRVSPSSLYIPYSAVVFCKNTFHNLAVFVLLIRFQPFQPNNIRGDL